MFLDLNKMDKLILSNESSYPLSYVKGSKTTLLMNVDCLKDELTKTCVPLIFTVKSETVLKTTLADCELQMVFVSFYL